MRFALGLAAILGASVLTVACGPSGGGGKGCKDKMLPGDLVITEVFADYAAPAGSSGADAGKEWFEIYNASDHPIDLTGLTLVSERPDDSKSNSHAMTQTVISPGQFMVLGNTTSDLLPAYMDYGYSADLGELFNSDGGKLALQCGSDEIDSAVYDGVKSGHSRELSASAPPDFTANDDLANWCQGDASEFDPGNFGTPQQDNDCTPVIVGQCNDNGTMRAEVSPVPGDLVITELMPQPEPSGTSATAEWFELKVNADVDLNGINVSRVSSTTGAGTLDSPDCIHVSAGSYVVLAKSTDTSMSLLPAGVTVATFKSSLSLISGTASMPGDLQISLNGTLLDAITWTGSMAGKSVQVDPDFEDPTANDDPSVLCAGQQQYYTDGMATPTVDLGTPGAENDECTILPPDGMCTDPGTGTNRAIVAPATGQIAVTEALANPMGATTANEFVEVLNTGTTAVDLNGLRVSSTSTSTKYPLNGTTCVSLAPAAYGLLAHSTDPLTNGGLTGVDLTFSTSLNLSKSFYIWLPADDVTPVDLANWSTGTATSTKSRELRPANLPTATADNDATTNYCDADAATQTFGTAGNFGTPKTVNICLP